MGVIEAGGQLNPDWVEWLMGWPVGWTSLEPLSPEAFAQWRASVDTWFEQEPAGIPRVASGVPKRMQRLKAIGNGQVPQAVVLAWAILKEQQEL